MSDTRKVVAETLIMAAVAGIDMWLAYMQRAQEMAGMSDEEVIQLIEKDNKSQTQIRQATLDLIAQKRAG